MKKSGKRYRIVKPVRFTAIITAFVLICVFAVSGIFGYSDASATELRQYKTVRVKYGDTMWDLAKTYGPENQDIRDTVYQICRINNMKAGDLKAGQEISVPVNVKQ